MPARRTSVICAGVSLLALPLLAGCDPPEAPQARSDVTVDYARAPAGPPPEPVLDEPEPVRDEKSDCAPGAPPSSLANALDVLKVHCDREGAYRKAGIVASVALLARFGGGGAAARGAVAGTAMETGAAGRAVAAARAARAATGVLDESETGAAGLAGPHAEGAAPEVPDPGPGGDTGDGQHEMPDSDPPDPGPPEAGPAEERA